MSHEVVMSSTAKRCLPLLIALSLKPLPLTAQNVPLDGVNGTVALEGTMKAFYRGVHAIVVTTVDGVEHVYHFAKDLVVHGGKGSGIEALEGFREGSTVVIHYSTEAGEQTAREVDRIGDQGLEITEGTITRVQRGQKRITVRVGPGRTETFQLTDRAAAETSKQIEGVVGGGTKVVIYYTDEHGQKVAHYFKRIS